VASLEVRFISQEQEIKVQLDQLKSRIDEFTAAQLGEDPQKLSAFLTELDTVEMLIPGREVILHAEIRKYKERLKNVLQVEIMSRVYTLSEEAGAVFKNETVPVVDLVVPKWRRARELIGIAERFNFSLESRKNNQAKNILTSGWLIKLFSYAINHNHKMKLSWTDFLSHLEKSEIQESLGASWETTTTKRSDALSVYSPLLDKSGN
jgi:hypothetical protein